jgi:hypothetical protein
MEQISPQSAMVPNITAMGQADERLPWGSSRNVETLLHEIRALEEISILRCQSNRQSFRAPSKGSPKLPLEPLVESVRGVVAKKQMT